MLGFFVAYYACSVKFWADTVGQPYQSALDEQKRLIKERAEMAKEPRKGLEKAPRHVRRRVYPSPAGSRTARTGAATSASWDAHGRTCSL